MMNLLESHDCTKFEFWLLSHLGSNHLKKIFELPLLFDKTAMYGFELAMQNKKSLNNVPSFGLNFKIRNL